VANASTAPHSLTSGFAIVQCGRAQGGAHCGRRPLDPTGAVTQDENVIPAKVRKCSQAKGSGLKITPNQPLTIGEYALVG